MKKITLLVSAMVFLAAHANSQSTAQQVYSIFQANCTVGCHSGSSPSGNLNLDENGNASAVYNNIVGVTPTNPAAAAKGHKLIDPGYPKRSFLLRKCAYQGFDDHLSLDQAEGNYMPDNSTDLAPEDVELIRQWILYGAPQSGQVVDTQTLHDFYHVNGKQRIQQPPAPPAGEGFQVHMGPFFLEPNEEIEFYKKHQLEESATEINRIDCEINDESHHFLLFNYLPGTQGQVAEGLREVETTNVFPDETQYMTGWVDSDSTILPEGTAYYLDQNVALDLNYHLINYSQDSILAAETYVNFYTQPQGTADKEMHSELLIYPPFQLFIPSDGEEYTFTQNIYQSGSNLQWNIWFLSTHTHKYGTGYDIYKRTASGDKGEMIYNGNYDTEYQFNQGFYDWEHPAKRYFDPLETINVSEGLIQEASYQVSDPNETAPFITFGLTTEDEMMLSFIQYTVTDPSTNTGVEEYNTHNLKVYPNPFTGNTRMEYMLEKAANVQLEVFNVLGERIETIANESQSPGRHTYDISASELGLDAGIYLLRLNVNGQISTHRIVKSR